MPEIVNPEVTDAVTQANVSVIAEAPAMAMASLYQVSAHSLCLMMENAVSAQQQMTVTAQAATVEGIIKLYASNTFATAPQPEELVEEPAPDAPAPVSTQG